MPPAFFKPSGTPYMQLKQSFKIKHLCCFPNRKVGQLRTEQLQQAKTTVAEAIAIINIGGKKKEVMILEIEQFLSYLELSILSHFANNARLSRNDFFPSVIFLFIFLFYFFFRAKFHHQFVTTWRKSQVCTGSEHGRELWLQLRDRTLQHDKRIGVLELILKEKPTNCC